MAKVSEKTQEAEVERTPLPDWVTVESKPLSGLVEDFYEAYTAMPEAANGILANRRTVLAAVESGLVTFDGDRTHRDLTIPQKNTLAVVISDAIAAGVNYDPN